MSAFPDEPAIPCGLVAKSFFKDTYNVTKLADMSKVTINENGIAWQSDVDYKFKNTFTNIPADKKWEDIQWLNMTNGKNSYSN